ncbi:predicted protein [Naegleria gruberi]|uniref:Predicted protein n=1 Tax=Naegleria gruberi TaxID=5762 RepID=D2VGE4_NAEGR|nr:uncharacterized protein NAEGRDRAFT_67947 [Naegleria gruberi]EFC43953.1 predicted protein [Naegleria gruberi]|eukprot:XP_002676697.1 predicted protein [Naegleria gruberi strain NEG-M]
MSVELKNGILGQKDRNVRIFGKDIGGMEGLNSIIAEFPSKWYYMKPLADYLVSNGSYEIGKSLRGFTYDWRVGVRERANDSLSLGGDYFKLQKLVEETFKLNGRKVSLLGHSMGGPFLQYFLANFVSQDWKDRYIYKYIPVAGPFDGTSFSLILYVTGTNWQFPGFKPENAKKLLRQYPSILFMTPTQFPYKYPFFSYKGNVSYHVDLSDIEKFLTDAQVSNGVALYHHEYSQYKHNRLNAPNVTTHCMYGYGTPTATRVRYTGNKELKDLNYMDVLHNTTVVNSEDGDGTVPIYSLELCDQFAKSQKKPVHVHRFANETHSDIINSEQFQKILLEILSYD